MDLDLHPALPQAVLSLRRADAAELDVRAGAAVHRQAYDRHLSRHSSIGAAALACPADRDFGRARAGRLGTALLVAGDRRVRDLLRTVLLDHDARAVLAFRP